MWPRQFCALPFVLLASLIACGDDGNAGDDSDVVIDENDAAVEVDASTLPPDAVSKLSASFTGPCPRTDLSWTNPDDNRFGSVLVLRMRGGAVEDQPEDGTNYDAGELLPLGAEVIFRGSSEALADEKLFFHDEEIGYAVFTATPELLYSDAAKAEVSIDLRLGEQSSSLEVNLDTQAATVESAPNFPLTVQADYDANADTLSLEISVLNESCRAVHNLKAGVEAISDSSASTTGDLSFDSKPTLHFGVGATAANASTSRPLVISGVDGDVNPVTIDLRLFDHPSLVVGGQRGEAGRILDSSGAFDSEGLFMSTLNFRVSGHGKEGAVSPDGEKLYVGHGGQPLVAVVDLVSRQVIGSADLTGANDIENDGTGSLGHVPAVALSPDHRFLYALLVRGDHSNYACGNGSAAGLCNLGGRVDPNSPSSTVELVRLDRDTLQEVDRVELLSQSPLRPRGSNLSLSADGSRAALALRREGRLYVVDLESMSVVDADSETAGAQAFDLSSRSTEPHRVAMSADGMTVTIAYRGEGRGGAVHDETLDRIDIATGQVSSIGVSTNSLTRNNKSGTLSLGPDGRLYYARKNGAVALSIFGGGSEVEVGAGETALAVIHGALDDGYYLWDGSRLKRFSYEDDRPLPFAASGQEELFYTGSFGHLATRSPL